MEAAHQQTPVAEVPFRPRSLSYLVLDSDYHILVGGLAGEGVFLFDTQAKLRIRLGDCDEKETESRSHLVRLDNGDILVFYGYRHTKKNHSLRTWLWKVGDSEAHNVALYHQGSNPVGAASLTGFGFAALLPRTLFPGDRSDTQAEITTFVTGLGKGVAKLWELEVSTGRIQLLGAYKAKHSTISAFLILPEHGKLLTGTSYGCIQEWPVDFSAQRSTPVEKGGRDCRILSKTETRDLLRDTRTDFLEDIRFPDLRPNVLEFMNTDASNSFHWNLLFPTIVLNPLAYDGQMDAEGRAHGHGSRLLEDGFRFEGTWVHGQPVQGRITGKNHYEYEGAVVGDVALPHGCGGESRHCGGAEMEVYRGGWKDGERHGLGLLSWKHTNPVKSKNHGVREWGFFRHGKPHGLRIHEWAADAPELPFAHGMETEIRRLGKIRCIHMHVEGKFFDEFHFHRADGCRWTDEDKRLLNVVETNRREGPDLFAANPQFSGERCGRSARNECWACMQQEEDERRVFSCVGCSLRVHRNADCAWPPELFEESFLGGLWMCFMCQEMFDRNPQDKEMIVAYDRHGEMVRINSVQDVLDLTRHNHPQDHPLKLYHISAES